VKVFHSQATTWVPMEPLPLHLSGTALGGGHGMEIAQSRCKWWIEGMFHLLKAIEEAPELTPLQLDHARGIYRTKQKKKKRNPYIEPWQREVIIKLLDHWYSTRSEDPFQ
jgi:hypothetical protein